MMDHFSPCLIAVNNQDQTESTATDNSVATSRQDASTSTAQQGAPVTSNASSHIPASPPASSSVATHIAAEEKSSSIQSESVEKLESAFGQSSSAVKTASVSVQNDSVEKPASVSGQSGSTVKTASVTVQSDSVAKTASVSVQNKTASVSIQSGSAEKTKTASVSVQIDSAEKTVFWRSEPTHECTTSPKQGKEKSSDDSTSELDDGTMAMRAFVQKTSPHRDGPTEEIALLTLKEHINEEPAEETSAKPSETLAARSRRHHSSPAKKSGLGDKTAVSPKKTSLGDKTTTTGLDKEGAVAQPLAGPRKEPLPLPALQNLGGKTILLTEARLKELHRYIPERFALSSTLTLAYATERDGFSLHNLYTKLSEYPDDEPVLLMLRESHGVIFGGYLSHPMKEGGRHFYGNGTTFIFTWHPEFKVFPSTHVNSYYMCGQSDVFGIGCGDGHYAISVDSDLNKGTSQPSLTFENPILTLGIDFQITDVEVWSFAELGAEGRSPSPRKFKDGRRRSHSDDFSGQGEPTCDAPIFSSTLLTSSLYR